MAEPTIRPIQLSDAEAFRDAVGVVRAERRYLLSGPPSSIEKARAFVESNINHGYPHFVIEVAGLLAGWCDITPPSDNEALRHVGQLGMALLPEHRGKGLGEQLLSATLSAGDSFGYTRTQLGVFATNDRAIHLYRKVGFVEEGTHRKYLKIDEKYVDEILMARLT